MCPSERSPIYLDTRGQKNVLLQKSITFCVIVFLAVILFQIPLVSALDAEDSRYYFSYERFTDTSYRIAQLAYDDDTHRHLEGFADSFTRGMNAILNRDLVTAEKELLEAARQWPEFFQTEFLLALIYEDKGDMRTAARFYKSYLRKLREYLEGNYRISGAIINIITAGEIPSYREARYLIETHLADHGIDLGVVRQARVMPVFPVYVILFVLFICGYLIAVHKVIPYHRRLQKVKNPPSGFWVCRHCGAETPELSKVCAECRRPRNAGQKAG